MLTQMKLHNIRRTIRWEADMIIPNTLFSQCIYWAHSMGP